MAELPEHDGWLTEPEAERFRGMPYTKRREEARLGRWTAKHAVAKALQLPEDTASLRNVVIRNAADGAPEAFLGTAPAPVSISMTDRADWAVCIVGAPDGAIGCDLEVVEPRSATFVRDYFTSSERAAVADAPAHHDLLANLIWSAKESALKVLRTGLRRDTRSVTVSLGDDASLGWRSLTVATSEQVRFEGWWRQFGSFVLTCAAASMDRPPDSITDPPPLDSAVPSHTWMARPR